MRREQDDDITKNKGKTRSGDEALFHWNYLFLWSFIPERLDSIVWESLSGWSIDIKKAVQFAYE